LQLIVCVELADHSSIVELTN